MEHETKSERFPSPVGMMSVQTAIIVGHLRRGKPGDTISDETLSKIIGMDIGNKYWNRVRSACRAVIFRHSKVWKRVYGRGYLKCLSDDEVIDEVEGACTKKQRKISRVAAKMLATVKEESLTEDRSKKFIALQRLMALHYDLTSTRTRNALTTQPEQWLPDIDKVLQLGRDMK